MNEILLEQTPPMMFAYKLSSTSASIASTHKKLMVLVDEFEVSSIIYNYERLSVFIRKLNSYPH